jgi:hypothetical protein
MQSVDQKQHRSDQPITESRTGRRSPQSLPRRRVPRGPAAGGQREGLRPVTSKQQPSVAAGQSTSHVPVATSSELAQAPDLPVTPSVFVSGGRPLLASFVDTGIGSQAVQ